MGLLLIIEVMNQIGANAVPSRVLGRTGGGIAFVPIVGFNDECSLVCNLRCDDPAHYESLGRGIAEGRAHHAGTSGCKTEDRISI